MKAFPPLLAALLALCSCKDEKPVSDPQQEGRIALKMENQKLKRELKEAQDQLASRTSPVRVETPKPAPAVSGSVLDIRTDHWLKLSAATAKAVPFIRRGIAAGVNDPYFRREAPNVADEVAKMRAAGDALHEEWKQSTAGNAAQQIRGIVELQKLLVQLEQQAREAPALSYEQQATAKAEAVAANGVEGVPAEVMKAITEREKRTSEGIMLEMGIKGEARDYLKVQAFKADEGIPPAIREKMMARASRKYPESWQSLWGELNSQADGFRIINRWEREGAPGLSKEKSLELIRLAKEKYPEDWNMIHYEVNQTADSAE